jgi:hypothetical protein
MELLVEGGRRRVGGRVVGGGAWLAESVGGSRGRGWRVRGWRIAAAWLAQSDRSAGAQALRLPLSPEKRGERGDQ